MKRGCLRSSVLNVPSDSHVASQPTRGPRRLFTRRLWHRHSNAALKLGQFVGIAGYRWKKFKENRVGSNAALVQSTLTSAG